MPLPRPRVRPVQYAAHQIRSSCPQLASYLARTAGVGIFVTQLLGLDLSKGGLWKIDYQCSVPNIISIGTFSLFYVRRAAAQHVKNLPAVESPSPFRIAFAKLTA